MLSLMAPALQGCRIESFQLTSGTAVGGGTVTGVIRVSPACRQALEQGLIRVRVTGNQPGLEEGEINSSREMPERSDFVVRTAQVQQPTDVTLVALLTVPLPVPGFLIVGAAEARVRLMPPLLGAIQFPNTLPSAGRPQAGTVTLVRPAPPGGAEVFLESSRPTLVMVPASVTVPEGMASATFLATPVTQVRGMSPPVTITAFHAGTRRQAAFTLLPLLVTEITAAPNPVMGGMPVDVTVRLNSVLREHEMFLVQVGARNQVIHVIGLDTFMVRVPTDRPQVPAGQRVSVPVTVTFGGQTVTAPVPLEVISVPQTVLGAQMLGVIGRAQPVRLPPGI